jgi:hypothetical protein
MQHLPHIEKGDTDAVKENQEASNGSPNRQNRDILNQFNITKNSSTAESGAAKKLPYR